MSAMLGAEVTQLESLAGQLGTTTGDIGDVDAQTQQIATSVTTEMQASFDHAIQGISGAMSTMNGTVSTARNQLADTNWTGTNKSTFDGAYEDFNAAMGNLEAAIGDAYQQFDGQLKQINGFIEEFQTQVTASLQDAQASTTSMQTAVTAQKDNLDMVMNTGLTVG